MGTPENTLTNTWRVRCLVSSKGTRVVAVSSLCMAVGASVGFIPGFVATALQEQLDISMVKVGLLIGVHFGCTGVGSIFSGWICEHIGARTSVILDMAIVAIVAVISALAASYWVLFLASMLAGVGYALTNVGTNVAITAVVPISRRTASLSTKTAGVPAMAVVVSAIGPWAANRWGWQLVMGCIGVIAAATALIALAYLDDDRPDRGEAPMDHRVPLGFIWFPVGAFLFIGGTQPLFSWTVPFFEQVFDFSPTLAGTTVSVASCVGVTAMILNGVFTDRLGPNRRVSHMLLLASFALVAGLFLAISSSVGVWLAAIGLFGGITSQLACVGVLHAALVDRFPHAVARATGMMMVGYYIGALVSPTGFGALVDLTGGYTLSWAAASLLLFLCLPVFKLIERIPVRHPEVCPFDRLSADRKT